MKSPFTGVSRAGATSVPAGFETAVHGVTLYLAWRDLETANQGGTLNGPGVASIASMISYCNQTGHIWKLRLFTNGANGAPRDGGAPAWVKADSTLTKFRHMNSQDQNPFTASALLLCAYWEPIWKTYYTRFINSLAALVDGEPTLHDVTISYAMMLYAEPLILDINGTATNPSSSATFNTGLANRHELVGGGPGYGTGNPASVNPRTITAPGAGFTDAKHFQAVKDGVDAHTNAFVNTYQSFSFNPYQTINSDASASAEGTALTKTKQLIDYAAAAGCALENNSARPDYFTFSGTAATGYQSGVMPDMYEYMTGKSQPVFIQTANATQITTSTYTTTKSASEVTMNAVIDVIEAVGCEPPTNFSSFETATIVSNWNTRLIANYGTAAAPSFTRNPSLSGTAQVGQTLLGDPGVSNGVPSPGRAYQWQISTTGTAAWTDIPDAIDTTWMIPQDSVGTATTYAADTFARTTAGGWGTAPTGGLWAYQSGGTANYSTNGTAALFNHSAANQGLTMALGTAHTDTVGTATVMFPSAAAGGNMTASMFSRWVDLANNVGLTAALLSSNNHVQVTPQKMIANTTSSLGTTKDLGAYTPGAGVKLKADLEGSTLQAKAWLSAGTEPPGWDWTVTDATLPASGVLALKSFRASGNTNTSPQTKWDDYLVTGPVTTTLSYTGEFARFEVTATNTSGTAVAQSAASTIITAAGSQPVWTALPFITGSIVEGQTLTATGGTATGGTVSYAYQWESSPEGTAWTPISGETAQTHTPPVGSHGTYRRCEETATNGSGSSSVWTALVGPLGTASAAPVNTSIPTLSGTAIVGGVLTATPGTWTGSPTPTITEQWQSSADNGVTWTPITDATGVTYTPTVDDAGNVLRVEETATNTGGATTADSSATVAVTVPTNFPNLQISVSTE